MASSPYTPPALQSPRSAGDEAMVIDDSHSGQSLEEGELSEDGSQPSRDTPNSRASSPDRVGRSHSDPTSLSKGLDSVHSTYELPEVHQSAPVIDHSNPNITRSMTSSPASSSSVVSIRNPSSVEDKQLANEYFSLDAAMNIGIPKAGDEPEVSTGKGAISRPADQNTTARPEDVNVFSEEQTADSRATDAIVKTVPENILPGGIGDGHAKDTMQSQESSRIEASANSSAQMPDAGTNQAVQDVAASPTLSDNDSDLYGASDPDNTTDVPDVSRKISATTMGTNAPAPAILDHTTHVDDEADDDDFYEPSDDLPVNASAPHLESLVIPSQPDMVEADLPPSPESEDIPMDVDDSSIAEDNAAAIVPQQVSPTEVPHTNNYSDEQSPDLRFLQNPNYRTRYIIPVSRQLS